MKIDDLVVGIGTIARAFPVAEVVFDHEFGIGVLVNCKPESAEALVEVLRALRVDARYSRILRTFFFEDLKKKR